MLKLTPLPSESKFSSVIMKKHCLKKLLVGEDVEVRHFGEGLEGSWHPAVVIAEKKSSRQVKHNELLCEDKTANLVEWIAVSAFVDGQFSSSKNHRGHIRPRPLSIAHGQKKLSYGLCVDAFVVDSWWEGVVFDREEDSDHRLLFFPDLGDQQTININCLRITHDWDEITGDWQARGYWSLIRLIEKFEQEKGPLPVSIRQIWYDVRANIGFQSKISAWTCGSKYLWDKFVMEAIQENISAQYFVTTDFTAGAKIANSISRKRRKIDKDQNNFVMPVADNGGCSSYNEEIPKPIKSRETSKAIPKEGYYYSFPNACRAWKEKRSSEGTINVNERRESCLDGEIDVNRSGKVHRGEKSVKAKDKTLCEEDGGSRESKIKWQPVSQTFLPGAEYCPQAISDYILKIKNRSSNQKGLENKKIEFGQLKFPYKEAELKAKMHLLAMHWRFEYFKEQKTLRNRIRFVSPEGKIYHSLTTACFALEEDRRRMVESVINDLGGRDVVLRRQQVSYFHEKADCVKAKGRVTYEGIKCKCCHKVYSLANSEAHAGSANRCPAAHIFLKDGSSLLECQIQSLQDTGFVAPFTSQPCKRRKISYSQCKNDSICSVCHYGGTLVLCDYCPSSFHLSCIDLKVLPEGKWFCPSCRCAICGQSGFNGDVDQFTDTTVLFCDQCEREYHVGCLKKRGLPRLDSCPQGDWFCSEKCAKIFRYLNRNVGRSKSIGVEGLSWTIVKSSSGHDTLDIEAVTEWHSKLYVALGVLHECFVPIVDPHTKREIVADVLFNKRSELNRLNFSGFYTMLLEKGDELISVAAFRIYGKKVAEMPLVATRFQYRRQGMCRLLVSELEKMLSALGIERLILPGSPQLVETWTTSFGFTKMTCLERSNLLEFTFLDFQDTTMCQKILMKTKGSRGEPHKHRDGSRNNGDIDCSGCNIFSEIPKTADAIQIIASDDVQTYSLHSQKVAVGDSHLANASSSPSSVCCGLDLTLQGTKHIEQSGITDGISRDIAVGEGDCVCVAINCLDAAGKGSADQTFSERGNGGIGYDSFKYFYTRRRILAS